jgi:hypothetical protein
MDVPDLTGAEMYTAPGSTAHGRWYILPADTEGAERVIYERSDDQCEQPDIDKWVLRPVVSAHLLRTSPIWTRVTADHSAAQAVAGGNPAG